MKRWAISLFLALATAVGTAADTKAPPAPTAKSLVGTWRLVAYEDHPQGRPVKYPFGEKPVGLLIYDASGHMAIQVMKVPHPQVASGDELKMTDAEKIALLDAYVAYFGTYSVDWAKGVITHHVAADLYDVFVGTAQERPFELDGDRLLLHPTWTEDGVTVEGVRLFERAP